MIQRQELTSVAGLTDAGAGVWSRRHRLARRSPSPNDVIRLTDAEREQFIAAVRPVQEKYRRELDPRLFDWLGVPR